MATMTVPAEQAADTVLSSLAAVPDLTLPMTMLAADPISHGAGNAGTTQLLRTQPHIVDGRRVEVPYVSGNSIRHRLRDALAWHLVRTLGVLEMGLARRVVDLLWSGGALTSAGNRVDLRLARRVMQILPGTSAMGYSAQSGMVAGTLRVYNAHLVCAENTNRMPPPLRSHPHAALPMAVFRGDVFGTRHDLAGTPAARYIRVDSVDDLLDIDPPRAGKKDTQQKIYDVQVIKSGSLLYSELALEVPTYGHVAALATAIDTAIPAVAGHRQITLGGKSAAGYGRCAVYAAWDAAFAPYGTIGQLRDLYTQHLLQHRDDIPGLLTDLVGS